MADKSIYSKKNIIEMEWHEAIRRRPGMYLGRINQKGFIDMMKRIFRSTVMNTGANFISMQLLGNTSAIIGFKNIKHPITNNWSQWNNNRTNPFLLELETLNALSEKFSIKFLDEEENEITEQCFKKGKLIKGKTSTENINCTHIEIECTLDKETWGEDFSWNSAFITHQIRGFAYLYKKTKFEIKYELDKEQCRIIYHFKNGLKDRLDIEKLDGLGDSYFETSIDKKIADFHVEIAFAFRNYSVDEPFLTSYVNAYYTHENGSHVDGLLKGLTYGVMKYFQKHKLTNNYKISEKGMKEHLIAIINIKMDAPVFSGCVKNKLANSEIIEPIANEIADLFFKKIEADEEATQKLIEKFKI